MQEHRVRAYRASEKLAREDQLAWKLAEVAADPAPIDPATSEMIVNRVLDNAGVAIAGIARRPVANARAQALCYPRPNGATIFGLPNAERFSCEWAAYANATAVRELDFHDTFLSADMNHPGDMIPAVIAAGQQCGVSGAELIAGIATAYEIDVILTKAICLHEHRIDHLTHLAAGMVAGIGAMLRLPVETIYQAINQAVHTNVMTRQSRKGEISTWKATVPGHTCKLAIEAVDRAMRGETSPSPIYEGDDSIIAWLLNGFDVEYRLLLPEPGEAKRGILETYTKAHSAEIQAQAIIDLAFRLRGRIPDLAQIDKVVLHTSHHTHRIIGSGSGDPEKYDPQASRETLDHSVMYILAVALEDGRWHHIDSYTPERAARASTVNLWRRVSTVEDAGWTARYHHPDPAQRAFGGRVVVTLRDGTVIEDELGVADAHTSGAKPFTRPDYIGKFRTLAAGLAEPAEIDRFVDLALALPEVPAGGLAALNVEVPAARRAPADPLRPGLFERGAA
ncbi:MmgE/PrpD family protein [Ancylobacter terrae]|uniref:MmgE/PrpD family protein n=1 Tax=Ancylobacter sp. sgz301288 TaxID=3342077 RepID=UPI003858AB81